LADLRFVLVAMTQSLVDGLEIRDPYIPKSW